MNWYFVQQQQQQEQPNKRERERELDWIVGKLEELKSRWNIVFFF